MSLPARVFLDTSYFIALLNSNDADHAGAVALQAELTDKETRKITSEYILLELGDGLSRLRFRHLARQLISLIYQDSSFEVVPSSPQLFAKALSLFGERADKEWGLTDCSSFVIMQEAGLDVALTADHHFQQAGFRALLSEASDVRD
jgi:predicted nucleic acid-binding protein